MENPLIKIFLTAEDVAVGSVDPKFDLHTRSDEVATNVYLS